MTPRQQPTTGRERLRAQQARESKRRLWFRIATASLTTVILGAIGYGLWSAQPSVGGTSGQAPAFTLTTTVGTTVSLADYRGEPVILYFNEGAGCGSCTQQMAEIEKEPGFAQAGITVLPIVMNTAEQIQPDLDAFGVTTPYLLDDGRVSEAYNTLGTGMHPGLPGHGFIVIDAEGNKVWEGNYPSMWLDPTTLLQEATSHI